MRIGVISDTHNHFDPAIATLFRGAEHIVHGGDIGLPWVLMELEAIAPVTAVLGNNDAGLDFKETELVEVGGVRLFLRHIIDVSDPRDPVHIEIAKARADVVVFGHSHKPYAETRDGILYLNPGYAGKPRFGLSRSVAILEGAPGRLKVEFKPL